MNERMSGPVCMYILEARVRVQPEVFLVEYLAEGIRYRWGTLTFFLLLHYFYLPWIFIGRGWKADNIYILRDRVALLAWSN